MTLATARGTEIVFFQSDPDYRSAAGISQSELKEVLKSPAHWLARYGPDAEPTFPTTAMIIGTATHAHLLEPDAFDSQFCDRGEKPRDLTVAELKAQLEEAQKNGDTDKIITLMGTLLSLEGAYDAEGADDDEPWSPREK